METREIFFFSSNQATDESFSPFTDIIFVGLYTNVCSLIWKLTIKNSSALEISRNIPPTEQPVSQQASTVDDRQRINYLLSNTKFLSQTTERSPISGSSRSSKFQFLKIQIVFDSFFIGKNLAIELRKSIVSQFVKLTFFSFSNQVAAIR